MLMGVKILKKYILTALLQLGTEGTCCKKIIFNKKHLFIILRKIKFLKCNTLQDKSGVCGMDSEFS